MWKIVKTMWFFLKTVGSWQYIYLGEVKGKGGEGSLKQCWHNIRRGGNLMILDYKGEEGVKNLEKSDYVIIECS